MSREPVSPTWRLREHLAPGDVAAVAKGYSLPESIAEVAVHRARLAGLPDDAFIDGRLSDLPAPHDLPGMREALAVLLPAIESGRRVAVFGDYDVDGVTGTTILVRFLREVGLRDAFGVVPNRSDGYGLTAAAVERLRARGAEVLITVDNGIAAPEAVAAARAAGLQVVVTDHHSFDAQALPQVPCVHPGLGESGPWAWACGAGVAFALAIALRAALRERGWFADRPEPRLVDLGVLAALGTVADMVPLIGANRTLVRDGIARLARTPWPGLQALLDIAKVKHFDEETFSFALAPRLNAAGRVADAGYALELLLTDDADVAKRLAGLLERCNIERKRIEKGILDDVERQLAGDPGFAERALIFAVSPKWPHGVLGIVAAKLMRLHHRPALLMQIEGEAAKGSGRSIPEVDLLAALEEGRHLTTAMGGHRASAGMTVPLASLGAFRSTVEAALRAAGGPAAWEPTLDLDGLMPLGGLTAQWMEALDRLRPFGMGNPRPLFVSDAVQPNGMRTFARRHLRFQVSAGGSPVDAVMFDGARRPRVPGPLRLAYVPRRDAWSRRPDSLALHIEDVQAAAGV